MSWMWVSRPVSGVARWTRSAKPVSEGVKTSCPRARSNDATSRHSQPPPNAPCTITKVAIGTPRLSTVFVAAQHTSHWSADEPNEVPAEIRFRLPN